MTGFRIFAAGERGHPGFFWLGALLVTAGVGLHLPMYIQASAMKFYLAGMPMDIEMLVGMALILIGTATAWYGLLPAAAPEPSPRQLAIQVAEIAEETPPDAKGKLNWAHYQLLVVLILAVVIDSMKPA